MQPMGGKEATGVLRVIYIKPESLPVLPINLLISHTRQ